MPLAQYICSCCGNETIEEVEQKGVYFSGSCLTHLKCTTCGKKFRDLTDLELSFLKCKDCGEPLEVSYAQYELIGLACTKCYRMFSRKMLDNFHFPKTNKNVIPRKIGSKKALQHNPYS